MQKRYRPPREYLLFIASFIIFVLCRYLSLYEINSRYMHLNEVFCLFAFLPKRIAQEALLTKEPTSHTTVRTDRYTAVQPHKCKDSQQLRMLKYPAAASFLFVMEHFNTGLPAIRQQPSLELGHAQVSTTTNIYAAMIRSSDAAAADALGNVFDRIKQQQEIG